MSSHGALVVIGCGPGVGQHVASLFATRGFNYVILASRNSKRLQEDIDAVKSVASGAEVDAVVADVGDKASLEKAFKEIDQKLKSKGQTLEVVLNNAAKVGPSELLKTPVEDLESDFKIAVSGLYTTAQWAIPQLTQAAKDSKMKPSFFVTGGMLQVEPIVGVFSLSVAKTAQHNLTYALYKQYQKEGVHVGTVCIGGVVDPKSKVTNPKNIAEKFWELYQQPQDKWTREIVVEEPGYWENMVWA